MAFSEYTETEIRILLVRFCHENRREMIEKVHKGLATVAAEQKLLALKNSIEMRFEAAGMPCIDDISDPGNDYGHPAIDAITSTATAKAWLDKTLAEAGMPAMGELSSDPDEYVQLSSNKRKRATTGRGASTATKKKKQPATTRKRAARKPKEPNRSMCIYCYDHYDYYNNNDKRAYRSHHDQSQKWHLVTTRTPFVPDCIP